jgi:hypothetical protein
MKLARLLSSALLAATIAMPAAARSETLAQSASARQAIMELEYQLNQPGAPTTVTAAMQSRILAIQTQINGNDAPALSVPVYGSCDANQATISYLQDEIANSDIDYQQLIIDQRAIHDLQVNSRQRGC